MQRTAYWFAIYLAACVAVFLKPLYDLARLSFSSDSYSHVILIPIISAALIYSEREAIFRRTADAGSGSARSLIACLAAGVLLVCLGALLPGDASLIFSVLSILLLVWSGFGCFFGGATFRAALFPLVFLLLMLPPPAVMLDHVVVWLQWGSADVTQWIFHLTRTPVIRDGLFFDLPGVSIEVARECSGIRSSIALGITCLAASYLFLRTGWTRAVLALAVLPVVIVKNGIRIATLSLLSIHVDPGFLSGRLHHEGGIVFFAVGLAMMLGLLRGLQRIEHWYAARGAA